MSIYIFLIHLEDGQGIQEIPDHGSQSSQNSLKRLVFYMKFCQVFFKYRCSHLGLDLEEASSRGQGTQRVRGLTHPLPVAISIYLALADHLDFQKFRKKNVPNPQG